jgi:hypothetical protein
VKRGRTLLADADDGRLLDTERAPVAGIGDGLLLALGVVAELDRRTPAEVA